MDEMCRDGNEKFGVLGKTVFASLRAFDVISSFPPDYMHAVLLGVMKQVWTMWTESEFHKQPFYIGNSLQEVEKRLLSFRPPSSFARYPRQLKEFKKYKANEWEAILLHYIYPALKGILPQVYLDHIMLLSSSIFKLLSPKLNESTINGCDKQLKQFETKFQTLYGRESMTYNVHLVRHLIQAVRNFGALYNFSLFPYESGNAMLLAYRTSNKKPILQIERKYCINKMCHYTELPSASPIQNWVKTVWTKEHTPLQFDSKTVFVPCDSVVYDDDVDEIIFSVHSRCHKNGLVLCTRDICKGSNYDDSWIEKNGSFYCITHILCDKNNLIYIVGQRAKTKKIYDNLYACHLTEEIRVVKVNDSVQQCIAMQIEQNQTIERFISRCKIRTQCD
ncbi:uncharacterized protein LOC134285047 [Aedes albopictus]|uniref:Uncharacterized protein n=1 Tax=Aedes albopictus TaxID=7160 RepID=A0ABM2A2W9_AEDAL